MVADRSEPRVSSPFGAVAGGLASARGQRPDTVHNDSGNLAEELEDLDRQHAAEHHPDLPDDRFLDREASWLDFNARVLELARDPSVPLLDRVRFLAIFANNLDEFFRVRVAGIKRLVTSGLSVVTPSGLSLRGQLELIRERARTLAVEHARTSRDTLAPLLAAEGIELVRWSEATHEEREQLRELFRGQLFPVLTPLAVDPAHPFPYISALSLNVAVVVREPSTGRQQFARVKVPPSLPRFVPVGETRFVPLEDVITAHLDQLFAGMDVVETHTFRVTRNEDVEVDEDDVENLLKALERELNRRRFGAPVRLEVDETMSERVLSLLVRELGVAASEVFRLPAPLDLTGMFALADIDRPTLHYPAYVPVTPPRLTGGDGGGRARSVLDVLRDGDLLVHHPYDSFATTTQAFVEQAAADPDVLAVKQTLYRTSGDSPIIDALIDAAEAGKQVLAVVEIKARFDEQANIRWARELEQAGCHVVYGIVGLKTHAKLCLVVRREPDGSLRRYAHLGTGNYNPKTARIYEDLGLLTADEAVGEDLTHLFNHLSGYTRHPDYHRLLVAPDDVRSGLVRRIRREVEHARAGRPAGIAWKLNSLVDETVVDALYRASMAGVPVDLLVRGMCALRPGGAGAVGDRAGAQRARPVPRTLADLPVRQRGRRRAVDRQPRRHAPQPRPAGGVGRAGGRRHGAAAPGGGPRPGVLRRRGLLGAVQRRGVAAPVRRRARRLPGRADPPVAAAPARRGSRPGTDRAGRPGRSGRRAPRHHGCHGSVR